MTSEMNALISELRGIVNSKHLGLVPEDKEAIRRAMAMLEAATSAPAVDREALARFFDPWAWDYGDPSKGAVQVSRAESLAKTDAIIASGILRDMRDVQAEALEQLVERVTDDGLVQVFGGEKFVSVPLLVSEA